MSAAFSVPAMLASASEMLASVPGMLLLFAASNLVLAMPLALLAWALQRYGRRPALAHLVWLVVLVKLVTPPVVWLPIISLPAAESAAAQASLAASGLSAGDGAGLAAAAGARPLATVPDWQTVLVALWLTGSGLVLAGSLMRTLRFDRLLHGTSAPAGSRLQEAAAGLARGLGLARSPAVLTTTATISPMVWWLGGRVRIYLPRAMVERLSRAELDLILAHEIGHVARRDHLVRWLECLVCIVLWWNPVAWWARKKLRACEELCCDAFVLSRTGASRETYAGALVSAMELLSAPALRPSSLASHVDGGRIERRIRMIVSSESLLPTPPWLRGFVLVLAAFVVPLGFAVAQDRAQAQAQDRADARCVDSREDWRVRGAREGVAYAERYLAAEVESAGLTSAEAEAIIADLSRATAAGQTEGPAYYEQRIEAGLIDRETADARIRAIEAIRDAWQAENRLRFLYRGGPLASFDSDFFFRFDVPYGTPFGCDVNVCECDNAVAFEDDEAA